MTAADAGVRTGSKRSATRAAGTEKPVTTAATTVGDEPHRDLLAWRDEFPILQRKTYLNSCSLGPLSRRSMDAMHRFMELWNEHGAQAWYRIWLGEISALREKFARIIGAKPNEVAIAPNVSVALA